jgi:hypothetical protein
VKQDPGGSKTAKARGDLDESTVTPEVGDEGGTPGDVEVANTKVIGTGSEAGETWRPAVEKRDEIVRDETGDGRRTP